MMAGVLIRRNGACAEGDERERHCDLANRCSADHVCPFPPTMVTSVQ